MLQKISLRSRMSWYVTKYCFMLPEIISLRQKSNHVTKSLVTRCRKSYRNVKSHITSFKVLSDRQKSYHVTKSCITLAKVESHCQKSYYDTISPDTTPNFMLWTQKYYHLKKFVFQVQKSNHATKNPSFQIKLSKDMTCDKNLWHYAKKLITSPYILVCC